MGAFSTRIFERNDKVVGQGRQVLLDAKALGIKTRQLDRLFHEFCKLEDSDSHKLDLDEFFEFMKVERTPFMDIFFMLFDKSKSGELSFNEYVQSTWLFLSSSDDNLASVCFQTFDTERSSVLEIFEVKYMVNMVWKFKPDWATQGALAKLDLNEDGFVTLAEFVLLYRHYPCLLQPLVMQRKQMRKRIVYSRFWRELAEARVVNFASRPIFDLLDRSDDLELSVAVLEFVAARPDVPCHYSDRWRDALAKRKDLAAKKTDIEADIPDEALTEEQLRRKYSLPNKTSGDKNKGLVKRDVSLYLDFEDDDMLMLEDDTRLNKLISTMKSNVSAHERKEFKKKKKKLSHKAVTPV